MWFKREPRVETWTVAGQRARRRAAVLNVNTRVSHYRGGGGRHRLAALILVPVTLAAAAVLALLGLNRLGSLLFASNPRFAIRRLVIDEGAVVTRELIQEWTNVREGMNLFGFDAGDVRENVLLRAPNVRSMEIVRLLPDTVFIRVEERLPLARVGTRGQFAADREGMLFAGVPLQRLPVIEGYPPEHVRPGVRLEGLALAALELIELCDEPRLGVRIASVAVNRPDHLLARILYEERERTVKLSWDGMGTGGPRSREGLERRLGEALGAFRSETGRQVSQLDATFPGKAYGVRE